MLVNALDISTFPAAGESSKASRSSASTTCISINLNKKRAESISSGQKATMMFKKGSIRESPPVEQIGFG